MFANLQKSFNKIGAKVIVKFADTEFLRGRRQRQVAPVRLNIITKSGEEIFEISVREDAHADLELSVLEVLAQDKHLLLLSRRLDGDGVAVQKDHFLCGRDERHLFVAAVEGVSTVAAAKDSLKPDELLHQETGLNEAKRNRRKTKAFRRQGEWFFIPVSLVVPAVLVRSHEPLVRGTGGKAHVARYAYRRGGESVMVCNRYPQGLTQVEHAALVASDPLAKSFAWRQMVRDATVFVKGSVRHADHATIVLAQWHRVLMNTEVQTETIAFLD
mgnify:CR=1 FL=1